PVQIHLIPHQVRRLVDAKPADFPIYDAMVPFGGIGLAELEKQLERELPSDARLEDKQTLARQQAQAAGSLLNRGRHQPGIPPFRQSEDPTRRTYLVHLCAALGASSIKLMALDRMRSELQLSDSDRKDFARMKFFIPEQDASTLQGVLLALGEFSTDQRAEFM